MNRLWTMLHSWGLGQWSGLLAVGKATRRYAGVTHINADSYDKNAILDELEETGVQISGLGYYPNRWIRIRNRANLQSGILESSSRWQRI